MAADEYDDIAEFEAKCRNALRVAETDRSSRSVGLWPRAAERKPLVLR
jgi:hypothetical protein